MKIYFESKADKETEKAQKKSELIAKKYGVSSSAVVWKGNDKFIVVKDGEEIEVDGRKVNEQIVRDKNRRRVSEPLSERNLTRAERYNRDSNKIFSYKRALDKEMKRYLVDNGVPEDEAEKLFQDDKLDAKLRELGLHDDFFDMWSSRKYGYDNSGEYYYIPESISKRTSRKRMSESKPVSSKKLNEGMTLSINGNNEVVLDNSDFSYLVGKYMGYDARDFFESIFDEYKQFVRDLDYLIKVYGDDMPKLADEIKELRSAYEDVFPRE